MRTQSLLIVGSAYPKPGRFPRCNATYTTLATYNADASLADLPNLTVWDNHDHVPNPDNVRIIDTRRNHRFRDIERRHGPLFANQFCYMLATVAAEDSPYNTVTLYGTGIWDEEHAYQFQYMTYWLGYLDGIGVSHTIIPPSVLLTPTLYQKENSND